MMPLTRTKPAHGYAASLWQTPIRQQPNVHVRRRPLNLVNKLNHLDATLSQNSTCLRIAQLKITRHIRTLTGHDDSARKAIDNNLETSVRTHELRYSVAPKRRQARTPNARRTPTTKTTRTDLSHLDVQRMLILKILSSSKPVG